MFAKYFTYLTACGTALLMVGCSSTAPKPEMVHSEAVKARVNLALAYLEQNDFPKAKENIDKALKHDESDYLPHSVLAYYFQQIGDVAQAESTYQKALNLSQNRPDVLNNYGTFLCKQGHFEKAYSQFELALKSERTYYHQAETLENIVLCAKKEPNAEKVSQTLAALEKVDKSKAEKLK